MKRIFAFLAVLTAVMLASCEKESIDKREIPDGGDALSFEEAVPHTVSGEEMYIDIIACVKVDGEFYYDTGMESTVQYRCGVMDGNIESSVARNRLPENNNQSNFGTGYGYQYGPREGTIEVFLGEQWRVFATEQVREQMQIEHLDSSLNDDTAVKVSEHTVREIGRGQLKEFVEMSDEDAEIICKILSADDWSEGTSDCENDCAVNLKGNLFYYHSECGTFNKLNLSSFSTFSHQEPKEGGKSLKLSHSDRATVNDILKKYISFSPEISACIQ